MFPRSTDSVVEKLRSDDCLKEALIVPKPYPPQFRRRALDLLVVVQAPAVARDGDPTEQVEAHFTLLRTGWDAQVAGLGRS